VADARQAIQEQAGLDRVRPLIADLQQVIHGLPSAAGAPSGGDGNGGGRPADGAADTGDEEVVDAEFTRG
jgi:molecular chaperone DnaK